MTIFNLKLTTYTLIFSPNWQPPCFFGEKDINTTVARSPLPEITKGCDLYQLPTDFLLEVRASWDNYPPNSKLDTFFKHLRIGENLCFLPAVCMNVALSHVDTWHGPWNYMSKLRHKHCNDDRTLSVCLTKNPSNILKQWTTKSGILAHHGIFSNPWVLPRPKLTQPVDLFSTSSGSTDQVEPAASLIRGITAGCSETTHGGFACCVQKIWGTLESLSDATATLPSPAMSASLYDEKMLLSSVRHFLAT